MANRRNGVPAGWQWRDGRPRWIPSPSLRAAGWRGCDLRDDAGGWLAKGPSIARAEAIVAAVDAWRRGRPVPADVEAIAPPGALEGGLAPATAPDPLSIGALLDRYLQSDELLLTKDKLPRSPRTIADYRNKLKRLVDTLAGFAVLPSPPSRRTAAQNPPAYFTALAAYREEEARYKSAVAIVRASSIFTLEPEEIRGDDGAPRIFAALHTAYWKLHATGGKHMASGVMACASVWLSWCRLHVSRRIENWAADVERQTPPGRIVTYEWPEVALLIKTADDLDLPFVGDGIALALDLSWSQIDILSLTWDRLRDDRAHPMNERTGEAGRTKTGQKAAKGGTPLLSLGKARVAAIRRRNAEKDVTSLKVVHVERRERNHAGRRPLSREADAWYFRAAFAEVRAVAAAVMPSLAGKTFADLRDTAYTWGKEAGLRDEELSTRTLQSLANIHQLGDRSYFDAIDPIADAAAAKMEALYTKKGVKL